MDNKILLALNDLTLALDAVADSLKDKSAKSNSGKILQSSDFNNQFVSIKQGLKSIKADTQQILKNQQSLKQISKEKKPTFFEKIGENAQKIKDGASTVLLIAAGVLAIGMAFKLIGHVDFVSVISLSLALPLIAYSFEKIANLKLKSSDMKDLFFTTITMATSLTVASWILSLIHPVSITQGLTAIFISGIFYLTTLNITKLRVATFGISNNSILNMGKVLLAITATIVASSWLMSLMHHVSITQGLTAILISGIFYFTTLNLVKLRVATFGITNNDILNMGKVLLGITAAIVAASWLMKLIIPISIGQALTAALISGIFYLTTLNIGKLWLATLFIKEDQMKKMGLVLLGITAVIVAASWLMNVITPITIGQGLTAALISGIFYLTTLNIEKLWLATLFIKEDQMAKMGLVLLGITATIVASSWLMRLITPITIGQGLTAVGIAIVLSIAGITLGTTAMILSQFGLSNILQGGVAILAIAGVIVGSSLILGKGKYDKYPTLEWAIGVGLSVGIFGLATIALGAAVMSGIGAVALLAGAGAVLALSGVIVASSYILDAGKYDKYPSFDWSSGVALSLGAFGAGTILLGSMIVGTLGGGLLILAAGAKGVMIISQAIVDSSAILAGGQYGKGPTKEWAEGVSESLGAFSPIFKVLYDGGFFSKSIKASDMSDAITTISKGIVTAGNYFNDAKLGDIWKGGPTKEWAEGVGGSIGAFTPVLEALSKSSGLFGSGPTPEEMNSAIKHIAKSIISVATSFTEAEAKNNKLWSGGPSSTWSENISTSLSAFAPIFDYLNQNSGWFKTSSIDDLNSAITGIASAMVSAANTLNDGKFNTSIPDGYMKSISDNIKIYIELVEYLENKNMGVLSFLDTTSIMYGISKLAQGYSELGKSVASLGNAISSLDVEKLQALNQLTGSVVLMSLMDPDQFEKMMDALEAKAGIFVSVLDQMENSSKSKSKSFGTISSIKTGDNTQSGASNDDMLHALNQIVVNTAAIARSCSAFTSYIDEIRGSHNSIKPRKHM